MKLIVVAAATIFPETTTGWRQSHKCTRSMLQIGDLFFVFFPFIYLFGLW